MLIIIIICIIKREKFAPKKEGFFSSSGGSYVDPQTNVIRGNNLFTNHMNTATTPSELIDNVKENQYYAESGDLGATANTTGLNKLMSNQVQINNINKRNDNKVMTESDMRAISKKIMSSAGNERGSAYNRAGTIMTNLDVRPGRIAATINRDYIGGRNKDHTVSVVKAVVPVQGYNISIDRIPEQMTANGQLNFMSNKISKNKFARVPSEAAARDSELYRDTEKEEGFKKTTGGYLIKNNTAF